VEEDIHVSLNRVTWSHGVEEDIHVSLKVEPSDVVPRCGGGYSRVTEG